MANQEKSLCATEEVDGREFQKHIFLLNANVLSPVIWEAEQGRQTLEEASEIHKEFMRGWTPWAIAGGIGLYSLKRKKPVGLLARVDLLFRDATDDEMRDDFDHFGEQVAPYPVGESADIDRQYKDNPRVQVFGAPFYYAGPPRLIKAVIPTRVFQGGIPSWLVKFKSEIDRIALAPTAPGIKPSVVAQGYRFFWAEQGKVYQLGFAPDDFAPEGGAKDCRITTYNPREAKEHLFTELEFDGEILYCGISGRKTDVTEVLEPVWDFIED